MKAYIHGVWKLYITAVYSDYFFLRKRLGMMLTNRFKMTYSSLSISRSEKAGILFSKREAFRLASRTARPWYWCLILSHSSCPVWQELSQSSPMFRSTNSCHGCGMVWRCAHLWSDHMSGIDQSPFGSRSSALITVKYHGKIFLRKLATKKKEGKEEKKK